MVWPKVDHLWCAVRALEAVPRPGAMGAVKSTFAQCKLPSIHRRRLRLR